VESGGCRFPLFFLFGGGRLLSFFGFIIRKEFGVVMKNLTVLLSILFLYTSLTAALTVYPDTPNAVVSSVFSINVDDTPIQVEDYMDYHYAHFAFDGTVEVTITASEAIHTFKISPLSLALQGQVSGDTLTFDMSQVPGTDSTPRHLVIKINDLEELIILADPPETDAPPSSGTGIFNVVSDFGADNTGATQTQPRIQAAIDSASSFGSASQKGIVYVPAGLYMIHEDLQLRSYVDLYLAPGAVLKSDENESHYDTSDSTIEAALEIQDVHDVIVRGRGELDASGLALMDPIGGTLTNQSPSHPRRRIISTLNAADLVIKDIIVKDGTGWSVEVQLSDRVLVQNIKVLNHRDVWYKIQNDGINNVSSDNMTVNQCFVITIDDAQCFKARFPGDGPMENGVFSNSVLWNQAAGVKCGMQNDHAMNNVVFRNIDIVHCRRAIAFDTKTGTPPVPISGPVFTDIRCEELEGNFSIPQTYVTEFYTETDEVSDVTITNFTCMENAPIKFSGNYPVSNVTYDNLIINGKPILSEADVIINKSVPVTNLVFKSDPYVTLSAPRAHGMSSFLVTVTFTENVTGLTASDFVVTNGAVDTVTGGPAVYSMTVTPAGSETVLISLPGGAVQDNESNGNRPSSVLEIPEESSTSLPIVASGSLYVHLEADSLGLENGAPVTSWTDLAGGHVFTGTAAYDAYYANGHAAVYFNGVGDMLASTGWTDGPSPANATLFVVGNFVSAETDSVSDFMISGQYPTGTTNNRFRILKFHDDSYYQFRVGSGGTVTLAQVADMEKHVFTMVSGRTTNVVDFLVDGELLGSGSSGTVVAMQALGLGGYLSGNNQFAECSIAEVLLYDGALTHADMTLIQNYLTEKYVHVTTAPSFMIDPIRNTDGIELMDYVGNPLTLYAYDTGGAETVVFSKDAGPDWLVVADDGTLFGIPDDSHVGENTFTVRVTDDGGLYDTAQMTIQVANVFSGINGMDDLLGFAAQWLMADCMDTPACGADLDGDNDVTLLDFSILASNWVGNPY
jgi:polygalacturonase